MKIHLNKIPKTWPPILGCDLETTGLDPFTGKILSIAFSDGEQAWVFLHFHDLERLQDVFADEKVLKIFHNAKFDLKWLFHHLDFEVNSIYDTMHAGGKCHSRRQRSARRVG